MNVDAIAGKVLTAAEGCPHRRYIVAVAGIPGSGKSTLAYPLADAINALWRRCNSGEIATCIGVDGWHFSQEQLRGMDDPERLFARRGAHFTFDGAGYSRFIKALDTEAVVPFPTFSHADKDPVMDGGYVEAHHRIIVIEGLHTLLNIPPWSDAAAQYDERILVDTPLEVARERIIRRHLTEGVEATPEAARRRADESDLLNAQTLLENLITPTIIVNCDGALSYAKDEVAPASVNVINNEFVQNICIPA